MQDTLGKSLKNLKWIRTQNNRISAILLVLSLIVTLNVFWALRQPGLTLAGDAACGITEHTHTDECFTRVLVCKLSEEAHIHTESCYTTRFTEQQEQQKLICTQTEDPHDHVETCYTTQLTEGQELLRLICEEPTDPHSHTDDCYEIQYTPEQETLQLICTETDELHEHTDDCYQTQIIEAVETRQLICSLPEEPHVHADRCYELVTTDPVEETILTCQIQTVPHEHTDDCYVLEVIEAVEEQVLTCALSEAAHIHNDVCYSQELSCELQEHVHSVDCYSDETADVETLLDWQNMFADYPYTGNLRQDLVGIAKTQAGYSESTRNFEIDGDGIRHGYTRYGAWYGTPYREWSAAFVSFCLNYAGADPAQTPGNIGANAMAECWKNLGRFAPVAEYVPVSGDLVFFTDNTVGIVTEVQNATFYVICGDVEDSVRTDAIPLGDASIAGWGITGDILKENTEESVEDSPEETTQETVPSSFPVVLTDELLDISNGPAFYIFAGSESPSQIQMYSFRNPRTVTNLLDYLGDNGVISYTLTDKDNKELPKDANGHYIAQAGTAYKLALIIHNPEGFSPGSYQYQIPNGLMVNGGTGIFEIGGVEVGTWEVSDSGLITMNFNNEMNSRTEVTVTATVGVQFPVQDDPISFDGQIYVTVTPPPTQEDPTVLIKSGKQGNEADTTGKTDPSKIYWTVEIRGNQDSQIPGSIITDKVEFQSYYGEHHYTASDMAAGIEFGATSPDGEWHVWKVQQDDPLIAWTDTGWSYKIPETVTCIYCGELTLGNEDWTYYVNYTSTPDPIGHAGALPYANHVTVDSQSKYGWVEFAHGDSLAEIYKTGSFQSDADGGSFQWEVTAVIPGKQTDGKADMWFIKDDLFLFGSDGNRLGYITNDADKATVTATYNGTTITAPHVSSASEDDPFAWDLYDWAETANGIEYSRNIKILSRCTCTAENCPWWSTGCDSRAWGKNIEFCQCWNVEDTTTFTLIYETTDMSLIEEYGGVGNYLRNRAELGYYPQGNDKAPVFPDNAEVNVTIPGLFKKELTKPYENSTAHYTITVNEGKLSLTNGVPLHIRDEMTETLAYVSGSLVIRAVDADGNRSPLRQNTDYTVTYDGTGEQKDANGKPMHVLELEILHPQPVMYILDYDTTLIIPPGTTQAIKYTNSANITLWGQQITDDTDELTHTDINISSKTYRIDIAKTCATSNAPLCDAVFGLFNGQGGQITTDVTDADGDLFFQTNIKQGIILREHVLYYIQELQAPPGYQLDDTEHWFVFCNNAADTCDQCTTVMGNRTAVRIPYGQIGPLNITNEIMNYDLPATGGPGIYPLILVNVIFVMTPLVYVSVQGRKRERRGAR